MADPPHSAVLTFEYDPDRAARIERALRPEVGDIADDRTRTSLDREGGELTVTVTAVDLVALRAGLNTWAGLVGVGERVSRNP